MSFGPSSVELRTQLFADATCATPNLTLTVRADYTARRDGEFVQLDLVPTAANAVLVRGEIVDTFNQRRACGIASWVQDQPSAILGRSCVPLVPPIERTTDRCLAGGGTLRCGKLPELDGAPPTSAMRDGIEWHRASPAP